MNSLGQMRCYVHRIGGSQQYGGHCVFWRAFRSGMTADALTLFTALHPEPTMLTLQWHAVSIEQLDLQGLL